jgi:carboxypeptidase family protein
MPSPPSMALVAGAIAFVLAGLPSPLAAAPTAQPPPQSRQAPPRDAPAPAARGTAVIRGRVVASDTGRPLRRARITINAPELGSDSRRTTSTSVDGRFEFKDLPAARYRVSVTRGGYLPLDYGQRRPGEQGRPVHVADAQVIEKIDFSLPRMGLITGRITDETGEPIEGVSVYSMRLLYFEGRRKLVPVGSSNVTTDDVGEYRILRLPPGTYFVMASTKETWTVAENGRETVFGYMPTYFPGAAKSAEARRITLGIGQEAAGTDISLVPGRAPKVSGHAVDSQGRPFARVDLREEVRGLGFASFRGGPSAPVAADGTFTIADVPPGEYTVTASRMPGSPDGEPEVALMPIVVEGSDIENISLVGSKGGTIGGRVVVEGAMPPKMSAVRVTASEPLRNQPSPVLLGAFRERDAATTKEDGTFSVANVFGRARFQVTVPEGWMLKSVTHQGRDITDAPIEMASGEELSGVEVLITDQVTSMGGQLLDEKNVLVRDATVLVFPSDSQKWFENARRVRAARPDQQGQWQVKGLPAGEYLVIALDYIEDGAWHDPEYLESLRRDAGTVTLAEGGKETVPLKVTVPR